jgi:predicted nucleic acid-binding protein
MSAYVIDASVAAKWFTQEEYTTDATRLLTGQHELHAPDFFMLEMDSIICKWVRRGIITEADGSAARSTLAQLPIEKHPFVPLRDAAYSLANRTGRSVYDCLYVALASLLNTAMVTADRRLYNALAAGPFERHVAWIEDVT